MKLSIFIVAFSIVVPSFAQLEKSVDSKITDVIVFLNKAQVTRQVKTRIEAGKTNILLRGLTGQLDAQSIQVTGKGDFIILGITHQVNYLNEFALPKDLTLLKDSIDYLQSRLTMEQNLKEVLNKEEQMLVSNQKIGGTNQNLTAVELKAMADFYRFRMNDIVTSKMRADDIMKKINIRIVKLEQQVSEKNELYARNTSEIIVSVSANASAMIDMNVNYIVSNAGWLPMYDLRAINTKSPVQLRYKANVYQSTGEEWKNVKLTLSTANPSLGGLKPELFSWYLNFYQPVYYDRKKTKSMSSLSSAPAIEMEKRDEDVAEAIAPTVADFVNTIQTTLNTEFDIALPYTVTSSNKPTLVDIRNYEMNAEYVYSVAPKLDHDAFLVAKAVGWEAFNLLPGEANIFFEGTFVGKSYIDQNSIKDTLSVSLGRDKRIIVKREKLKDLSSRKFIGANQRESFTYQISVRNTKTDVVKIIVEDQVPVAQDSQIEVSVTDVGAAYHNKDTGKLSWEITLQPSETKTIIYKFDVKYPKDRQIEGL